MASNGKTVTRNVRIVVAATSKLSGLNQAVALFKTLNAQVAKLETGLSAVSRVQLKAAEIANQIKAHQARAGGLAPGAVGGLFGVKDAEMKRFAAQLKKRGMFTASGEFSNAKQATQFMQRVLKERNDMAKAVTTAIRGAGAGGGTIAPEALGKKAAEGILAHFERVTSSFEKAIQGRNAQGQFAGGEGSGGGKKKKKGSGEIMGAPAVPDLGDEVSRRVTRTPDYTRTVVRQQKSLDRFIETTFDEAKKEVKEVTTTKKGFSPLQDLTHRQQGLMEQFRAGKAGLRKGDLLGMASLQESMAGELEKVLTDDLKAAMGPARSKKMEERLRRKAGTLRTQAAAHRKQFETGVAGSMVSPDQFYRDAKMADDARIAEAARQRAHVQNLHARQNRALQKALAAGQPPVGTGNLPPPKLPKGGMGGGGGGGRGMGGGGFWSGGGMGPFAGMGGMNPMALAGQFARNTAKVSMWNASVVALYGSLGIAADALNTVLETGLQTQRLTQVFTGVGGSARELTMDVLSLAAAEGRSRDEAMEAAISWSRLGLTRQQVNEATRQSLVAANVAEIDAAEATQKLQAIMAAYQLQVSDLRGTLGQLNETSNTFNVTNKDLFDGLTRTASVAKQAGVPLQELIGILGAGVGTTGQSGAMIGNAVKSIIVALNTPDVQKFLRTQHGVEVTQDGGRGMKPMNEVLSELFVKFQGMGQGQKSSLVQQVAGKTQASRFAAILDSYVKGQVLAVNAQQNLNSAEEENARIKDSLISKLKTLRSEWDRLIVGGDNATGMSKMLGGMVEEASAALRVLNKLSLGIGALTGVGVFKMTDQMMSIGMRLLLGPSLKDRLDPLVNQQQQAAGNARAAGGTVNLLNTARGAFGQMRTSERKQLVQQLSELRGVSSGFGQELAGAVQTGNLREIERVLDKEIVVAEERRKTAAIEEAATMERQKAILQEEIASEKARGPRGAKRVVELERRLAEAENQKQGALVDFMDDTALGQYVEMTLKALKHTEQTRMLLGQIADIYRQMPASTLGERNAMELKGLEEQARFLEERIEGLKGANLSPGEMVKVNTELTDQLHRVQAEIGSRQSPEMREQIGRADRAMVAQTMAGAAADRFTFGATPMDQMTNRIAGLQRLLAQKEAIVKLGQSELERENAMVEAAQLRADLTQTQLERERERGRLVQQEFEMSRRMLTSGPQEMMNRLVAQSLVNRNRGINAGQFFSFSPEMRQAMLDADQSRRNRDWLRRTPGTEEMQRRLGLFDRGGGSERLNEQVNSASMDLGRFQERVNGAAAALVNLQGVIVDLEGRVRSALSEGVKGGWGGGGTGAPMLAQGMA